MYEIKINLDINPQYFYTCIFSINESGKTLYEMLLNEQETKLKSITVHVYEKDEKVPFPPPLHSFRYIGDNLIIKVQIAKIFFEGEEDDSTTKVVFEKRTSDPLNAKIGTQWNDPIIVDLKKNITTSRKAMIKKENDFKDGRFQVGQTFMIENETYTVKQWFYCALNTPSSLSNWFIMLKHVQAFCRENRKFDSIKDFLIRMKQYSQKNVYYFRYDNRFESGDKNVDLLDPSIETSGCGDCEDIAHFSVRFFRMIREYGPRLFGMDQKLLAGWEPFFAICRLIGKIDHGAMVIMHWTDYDQKGLSDKMGNSNEENLKFVDPMRPKKMTGKIVTTKVFTDHFDGIWGFEGTEDSDNFCAFDMKDNLRFYYKQYDCLYYLVSNVHIFRCVSDSKKNIYVHIPEGY